MSHSPPQPHVALLRGINVGGRNAVPMSELAACVGAGDYADVRTYIQSGNVVFTTSVSDGRAMEIDLERRIEEHFSLPIPVVVRSLAEMTATIDSAPANFGSPDLRCDVIFLKHPLSADEAFGALPEPRGGVDAWGMGPGCVYASRVAALATKSRLGKIASSSIYPAVTIRNWNTTTKLHSLLSELA